MTQTFRAAFDKLIGVEGGYSNNPSDSGGPTRWGVTESVARKHGYRGDMRHYPKSEAERVYWLSYWQPLHLDAVSAIAGPELAYELFEQGVNMGVARPARWLQVTLNSLNRQGRDYADIAEDGQIGPQTLGALEAFARKRGGEGVAVLLTAMNCLQGAFYIELARQRPKDEEFLFGWLAQRV